MPVVSNTSPILNLAIINQLIILQQQFGEILIPSAVLDELKISEERPDSQAIREAISAGWIQSRVVSYEPVAQLLNHTLDIGLSEAIARTL